MKMLSDLLGRIKMILHIEYNSLKISFVMQENRNPMIFLGRHHAELETSSTLILSVNLRRSWKRKLKRL